MSDGMGSAFDRLIAAEARCKVAQTCSRLTVRELFFEPNPYTLETWRREHGFYENGIDTRVVFVCESPSDRRPRDDEPEFEVEGQKGWTCWNYTGQDARFREARVRHGFQHCLITNAVKCGLRKPSTPANLTSQEAENCSVHLVAELDVVRPVVVACLGESALRIVLEHALPKLAFTPLPVAVTHYSARGTAAALQQRWETEFGRVETGLAARGVSPDAPVWMRF